MYSSVNQRKRIRKGIIVSLAFIFPVFFLLEKGELVLKLQEFHTPALDQFFAITTRFGEAYVLIPFLVLFIFLLKTTKKEKLIAIGKIALMCIALLAITQGLKRFVFDFPRPYAFFQQQGIDLLLIEGVKLRSKFSFPSGHTASAFFGYFLFFYLLPQFTNIRWAWVIPALIVASSRIYLGQHFLHDIWFGATIGWLLAELTLFWLNKRTINLDSNILE